LPRFHTLVFAGLAVALTGARSAPAQTTSVAHLAVQSGNGQAACICITATLQAFQPISVKAIDTNGNPVAGATIAWSVTSGQITLGAPPATTATSITGSDGIATEQISLIVLNNIESTAVPYLVSTIQASSNNNAVTFTETQSLVTNQGSSVIQANGPTLNGANLSEATLSGNVGSTLGTPIQTLVGGVDQASNGVANISVRIFNVQTSPTLTCAFQGGYADPGSVLSGPHGTALCNPTFNGSGTGSFYVLIGGVAGSGTTISSALYLQQFGPYQFTSQAGAPAAIQIVSGNNQVVNIGTTLNPLVAKLVDAGGNPVQGQAMTWSVVPAGAIALSVSPSTTDNNGEVSITGTLNRLASAGAQVTVALASNPQISATFQETVTGSLTTMAKVGGDGQTAQEGTTFAQKLVVQLNGASGPVVSYPVQFLVNGPVTLVEGTTINTDANGQAAVTVKAGALTGTATVTAVAGALTQVFNLTVTSTPVGPPPNGMTIVSGNPQGAIINTTFAAPLIVQVNSTAGPVAGYVVNFSSTGPVSLSTAAVPTNSSGQASITVTAGAAPGAATVTASISGFSQTFTLNVLPPGPNVTPSSFLNAASRQVGALSPCSLAIISAQGLTPDGIGDLSPAPIVGRLPHKVHNLGVTFAGIPAPIVSVAMGASNPEVTLQVPCEVTPGASVAVVVTVNNGGTATANIPISVVSPGVFQTVMSDGNSRAVVVRDDGSFADIGGSDASDPNNPARLNENVRLYLTGLGVTTPAVGTDSIQNPNADLVGRDAVVAGVVQAGIVGGPGLQVVSARQAPGLIGVYEVEVFIPNNAPTGNNVPISFGIVPLGASSGTPAVTAPTSTLPIGQ
jgi:uncharacterized protein (TIGR03437 family)